MNKVVKVLKIILVSSELDNSRGFYGLSSTPMSTHFFISILDLRNNVVRWHLHSTVTYKWALHVDWLKAVSSNVHFVGFLFSYLWLSISYQFCQSFSGENPNITSVSMGTLLQPFRLMRTGQRGQKEFSPFQPWWPLTGNNSTPCD